MPSSSGRNPARPHAALLRCSAAAYTLPHLPLAPAATCVRARPPPCSRAPVAYLPLAPAAAAASSPRGAPSPCSSFPVRRAVASPLLRPVRRAALRPRERAHSRLHLHCRASSPPGRAPRSLCSARHGPVHLAGGLAWPRSWLDRPGLGVPARRTLRPIARRPLAPLPMTKRPQPRTTRKKEF
nr:uncharacterized protein LOC109733682 [Aegilops tauschii subsp. strangulata]